MIPEEIILLVVSDNVFYSFLFQNYFTSSVLMQRYTQHWFFYSRVGKLRPAGRMRPIALF